METHSAPTQKVPGRDVTVQEAMTRVTWLLDEACADLLGAQQAVDDCVTKVVIGEEEMRSLQKLDSATQIIEAVATILRNLTCLSTTWKTATVSTAGLYDGVKLSAVQQVLRGESAPDMTHPSGEIDFF
ncbi:conserved hypothetical protein [Gluconacetobacter diazotrophicus PA1 5]|nr:hypothetical protein [Gluconacetobacter diazotrophicus]ACI53198.1 conserved hypothetical protein [Gluconacetobacter diazotrophicus PA1 5]MBB2156051.1 hypothetical protein [Gluconacetobacter diazotrophicus]TWB10428.1 hypothetical protein FBZ86_102169 [Gluconacetobacter diazotrophicus]